jgi:hypothetical protein
MDRNYINDLILRIDSNNELMHYASQYYDPDKAHEYYMKNRQLKGRTTSGLTDEGKDVWTDTKANIDHEKKTKIMEANLEKEVAIQDSRSKAESTRTSITNKLKALSDQLSAKYKSDNATITNQIKAINKNSGLSDEQKEAKKEKLYEKRDKLSSDRKEESAKNLTEAKTERNKIATDLKGAIQNARDTYSNKKEEIKTSYENTYQEEYDKIKSQYTKTKKK